MSGRGEWWEVNKGMVMYMASHSAPEKHVLNGIDWTVARMAIAGEADAVAAVLECPGDHRFQDALKKALEELE